MNNTRYDIHRMKLYAINEGFDILHDITPKIHVSKWSLPALVHGYKIQMATSENTIALCGRWSSQLTICDCDCYEPYSP